MMKSQDMIANESIFGDEGQGDKEALKRRGRQAKKRRPKDRQAYDDVPSFFIICAIMKIQMASLFHALTRR
jgi:hypothetical protein